MYSSVDLDLQRDGHGWSCTLSALQSINILETRFTGVNGIALSFSLLANPYLRQFPFLGGCEYDMSPMTSLLGIVEMRLATLIHRVGNIVNKHQTRETQFLYVDRLCTLTAVETIYAGEVDEHSRLSFLPFKRGYKISYDIGELML